MTLSAIDATRSKAMKRTKPYWNQFKKRTRSAGAIPAITCRWRGRSRRSSIR
jgi:hypothetical protein